MSIQCIQLYLNFTSRDMGQGIKSAGSPFNVCNHERREPIKKLIQIV